MNKQRRELIAAIRDDLEGLQARVEELRDEEQDAYDNLPESLQDADQGQRIEEARSHLDDAVTEIVNAIDSFDNAMG